MLTVIIAPSHLAGAVVTHRCRCEDEVTLYLDRPHPTKPGVITVAAEDAETIDLPEDKLHGFRDDLGLAPETPDVIFALAQLQRSMLQRSMAQQLNTGGVR